MEDVAPITGEKTIIRASLSSFFPGLLAARHVLTFLSQRGSQVPSPICLGVRDTWATWARQLLGVLSPQSALRAALILYEDLRGLMMTWVTTTHALTDDYNWKRPLSMSVRCTFVRRNFVWSKVTFGLYGKPRNKRVLPLPPLFDFLCFMFP